jgi:capsular exopolysaccharide synthesis family protein
MSKIFPWKPLGSASASNELRREAAADVSGISPTDDPTNERHDGGAPDPQASDTRSELDSSYDGVASDTANDHAPGASSAAAQAGGPANPFSLVLREQGNRRGGSLRLRIGELLLQAKKIQPEDIETSLKRQALSRAKFGEVLISLGLADASDVVWALSRQSGVASAAAINLPGICSDELVVVHHPHSAAAEVIRGLRAQLLGAPLRVSAAPAVALALTSANVGDGKTYLASNLALSLAQLGRRTLLIEANLRMPRLPEVFFGLQSGPGLGDVLSGRGLLSDAVCSLSALPTLHLLPAGSQQTNPGELLQQSSFGFLLSSLLPHYEFVVVDTPAFAMGADAMVVAEQCGAALPIARTGRSRMQDLKGMVAQLRKSRVTLAGLVMNAH